MAAGTVVIVLAVALALHALVEHGRAAERATPATSTARHQRTASSRLRAPGTAPSARSEALALYRGVLAPSAAIRAELVADIAEVEAGCSSVDPARTSEAASAIGMLVTRRGALVTVLDATATGGLARGELLRRDLRAVLTTSLASDRAFAAWAADMVGEVAQDGGCPGATTDPNWVASLGTDSRSTAAEEAFLDVWDQSTAGFGLPAVTSATL